MAATMAAAAPVPAPEAGGAVPLDADRKIARTASVWIVVDDVAQATTNLHDLATAVGGVITSESVSLPTDSDPRYGSGMVVVTVPSDQLDAALTQIATLGKVTNRQIDAVDVTEQVVDVDSRVTTLKDSIARLQELMAKSGSVTEIAAVESELTQRQADLESLLAQQKSLSQRVATAPISVQLSTPSVTEQPTGNGFISALRDGVHSMATAGRVAIIVIGAVLPWLALVALIVVPILVIRRRHKRAVQARNTVAKPATVVAPPQARPAEPATGRLPDGEQEKPRS